MEGGGVILSNSNLEFHERRTLSGGNGKNWAGARQNQQEDIYAQGRLKSAWTSAHEKHLVFSYPLSAQRRLWSDWANAEADLSLRWATCHFVGFAICRFISCLEFLYSHTLRVWNVGLLKIIRGRFCPGKSITGRLFIAKCQVGEKETCDT